MKDKRRKNENQEIDSRELTNRSSEILSDKSWKRLMEIRRKLGKGKKKSSVEILYEMRR
jgi:hypothetical protein